MKIRPEDLTALGIDRFTAQAISESVEATQSTVTISANDLESLLFSASSNDGELGRLREKYNSLERHVMSQPDYPSYVKQLENRIKTLEELIWQ